jgi:uncharacterized integral membrane protein
VCENPGRHAEEERPVRREHIPPDDQDPRSRDDLDRLEQLRRHRQSRVARLIVALIVLVILLVFVLSNSESVPVSFVLTEREAPLIWVMLGCAVLGAIVGFIAGRPGRAFRFRREEEQEDDERLR